MQKFIKYPSIFNDVIGPVMRGPSASHCAASVRIGRIARDLMDGKIEEVLIEFDANGSLAHTHNTHGSDIGLYTGFLGRDVTDDRLSQSFNAIKKLGIKVEIKVSDLKAGHPNTYRISLKNSSEKHQLTAISTGGGIIEIIELDGIKVSIAGDYFESLIYLKSGGNEILEYLKENVRADEIMLLNESTNKLIEIKAQNFLQTEIINQLNAKFNITRIRTLSPVLPVLSHNNIQVPFLTCEEMIKYNENKNLELWELAVQYECMRGKFSKEQVFQKMKDIVIIIQQSIKKGIEGTEYSDRILGFQSGLFSERMKDKQLLAGGLLNQIILYVTALMEMKSSMGLIVAAPTAGSCGALPGSCIGAASALGLSADEITKSMLAAGLIGIFIAARSTFAAEVCGCQAECGAGSGMAAAALVSLAKGTLNQSISAASMALQNTLGMICDPVANRVEVPCLGKNVMAASNAFACANMALADFDPVIPLDEVINSMDEVGKSIPYELRCTALGGLSVTKTSKEIEKELEQFGLDE